MRIARLDLIAFGCFDGQRIDFDQNPDALQLVYGPNEAGKSTCLRAIGHWLFGFPHNIQDDFRHPAKQLRIGGIVEKRTGDRLEFIRRRGTKNVLRCSRDLEVIKPERLESFLGGIDLKTFQSLFGIDHEELRAGGQNISQSEGQLSQILFAAGSGLGSLRKIQEELKADYESLYTPAAKNRPINDLLIRITAASKKIKESTLSTERWKRITDELSEKQRLRAEVCQQIESHDVAIKKLERIKQGIPLAADIRQLNEQLGSLASASILPGDFTEHRVAAETSLRSAKLAAEKAKVDVERLRKELNEIALPETLLQQNAAIKELQINLRAFRNREKERPQLEAEIQTARTLSHNILKRVGLNAEQKREFFVDQWQRERIDELAQEFQDLSTSKRTLTTEIARYQDEINNLPNITKSEIDLERLAELKHAVAHAQSLRGVAQNRQDFMAEKRQIEAAAELELQRLPLFQGPLSELEKLKVPLSETVGKYAADFIELEQKIQLVTSHLQDSEKRRRRAERAIERLRCENMVPSLLDLESARQARDAVVQLAIQVVQGESSADSPDVKNSLAEIGASADLPVALVNEIDRADQIADQLRRDADHVAELAKTQFDLESHREDQAEQERNLNILLGQKQELEDRWANEWDFPNAKPLSPAEMRGWLASRAELIQKISRCRELNSKIDTLSDQERVGWAAVLSRLHVLNITPEKPLDDINQVLDFAERKILNLEQTLQDFNARKTEFEHLDRELTRKRKELSDVESRLKEWQDLWQNMLDALQLPSERTPKEVKAFLQALDECSARHYEATEKQNQLDRLLREQSEFASEVRRIAELVGMSTTAPTEAIAVELGQRLETANDDFLKRQSLLESLNKAEAALNEATNQIKHYEDELAELCRIAKCNEPSELPECERLSRERLDLTGKRDQQERNLTELAAEIDRDTFMAKLADADFDKVVAEIEHRKFESGELKNSLETINQQIGSLQKEVNEMNGNATALQVKIEREQLLASLRREVDDYIRLRLAATILHQGMERYREQNQGPALARASEIFSQLTDHSFAAVRPDFDESGEGHLLAIRAGDHVGVSVDGLSSGTQDQMYLAIRLALLEHQLFDRQPMPLILDDILIHFDDHRSQAALRVLAALAQKTQVILFTHHRHLIELAQQTLAGDQFLLHELTSNS